MALVAMHSERKWIVYAIGIPWYLTFFWVGLILSSAVSYGYVIAIVVGMYLYSLIYVHAKNSIVEKYGDIRPTPLYLSLAARELGLIAVTVAIVLMWQIGS